MIDVATEPTWNYEDAALKRGYSLICGVDEVGRGSLAGPVVAAAVILDRNGSWKGIKDSKLLTHKVRKRLFGRILEGAVSWSVSAVDSDEVDRVNVLNATIEAMRSAVLSLEIAPDYVLIDSVAVGSLPCPSRSIIKGDRASFSIAAASIVAKVYRDSLMERLHSFFPQYDFCQNKGYGTKRHRMALSTFGPCMIHRRTFNGVVTYR